MRIPFSLKWLAAGGFVVIVAAGALIFFAVRTPSNRPTAASAPGHPSPEGAVTLTGENRIRNLGLHNDVLTPCGPPAFKGAPPFTLSFTDNTKQLRLTVKVDSGSGSSPFKVVGDPATGAHAALTLPGYKGNATSGTVDLTTKTGGTFELHFQPVAPETTSPSLVGAGLRVQGNFSCV